ncbi:hypothetical protein C8R46DRAFT_1027654 [Mycena filopes]|nr:hypothetical protein C8R46DRAFT_1027654 [Mycena filopes]
MAGLPQGFQIAGNGLRLLRVSPVGIVGFNREVEGGSAAVDVTLLVKRRCKAGEGGIGAGSGSGIGAGKGGGMGAQCGSGYECGEGGGWTPLSPNSVAGGRGGKLSGAPGGAD